MKKISFVLFAFCFGFSLNAQVISFSDNAFKYVMLSADTNNNIARNINLENIKIDTNSDGEIEFSETEQVYYLYVDGFLPFIPITQIYDVGWFSNLKGLEFNNLLEITNLDNLGLIVNSNIENLGIYNTPITSLDLIEMPDLNILNLNNISITSIDLTMQTQLLDLDINQVPLVSLDLSNNYNLLSTTVTNNSQLNYINFKNGGLNTFEFSFYNNPNLQYICADEEDLEAAQQLINQYGYTNCHVNSYCSFIPGGNFYIIEGDNKFDVNSNGCDVLDMSLPFMKYNFTNGSISGNLISNNTGNYSISVEAGTHIINPILENPSYFSITPPFATVEFPTTTSPFIQNFCIIPNGIHNDLEVLLFPLGIARPGFTSTYKIVYKNKGTQSQSGTVNLTFEDAVMNLVVSNPLVTNQTTNILNWTFSNLQPFETRQILVDFDLNSPSDTPALNSGDSLSYAAVISGLTDETPLDNTATLLQTVVNSFDPNDKICLEGTAIQPTSVGEYVHYRIRFENTGSANAQNVVVKDMIDTTKFDVSTLVPIDGSHDFVTRISNTNQVEFIFENIQLPFDDANNDGYVVFKIKTNPNLALGDTFSNTASIYFDYNFPIVTNTYTTTIAALASVDFEFSNYFELAPNPTKNILNIRSKNAIELSSVSIYNTVGQLVLVIPNAKETSSIDVSQLTSGTYFLQVLSDQGSSNSKFIKE